MQSSPLSNIEIRTYLPSHRHNRLIIWMGKVDADRGTHVAIRIVLDGWLRGLYVGGKHWLPIVHSAFAAIFHQVASYVLFPRSRAKNQVAPPPSLCSNSGHGGHGSGFPWKQLTPRDTWDGSTINGDPFIRGNNIFPICRCFPLIKGVEIGEVSVVIKHLRA